MEPERFCTRRRTPSNGAPGTSVSMSLDTPHLTLRLCAPEHLLTLIDQPERFEQVVGVPVADRLHGFYVSDDVSPDWLAALRSSSGPDPCPPLRGVATRPRPRRRWERGPSLV